MSPQAGFILQDQIVPRLQSAIPKVVHCVNSEDHRELIQDSIAMAAKMMHNLESTKKKVTPGNIAYYTIQHQKAGRRSTGSSYADVMGSGTQLKARTRLTSMEEVVAMNEETGGDIFLLHDVLSSDQEDPGTKAARKMDWEQMMKALSPKEQIVINSIVEGRSFREAAKSFRVSNSTMQKMKHKLAVTIQDYMGCDILADIQCRPKWRNDLDASKERLACKHDHGS